MKILRPILTLLALAGNLSAVELEVFEPPVTQAEQYRSIWEKSPFVAEKPANAQKQGPGLAQRFVLAGIATLNNEPLIFVLDRQSLARLVVTKKSDASGLQLVAVDSNPDPKQASATVQMGSEQGVIRYDLAALQSVNQSADQPAAKGTASPTPAPRPTSPTASGTMPVKSAAPRPTKVIRRSISLKPPTS